MRIRVRRGDTLWFYSRLFSIPLNLLMDSNRDVDPAGLQPGQEIRIPGYVTASQQVQAGNTIWQIASRYNIPPESLYLLNPGVNPANLAVGSILIIPVRVTWRVVSGNRNYDSQALVNELRQLAQIYPFIGTSVFGSSVMGKNLFEVTVGNGPKRVHVNASFHAIEWITTPVLMTQLNDYLLALTNEQPVRGLYLNRFYNEAQLSVVPMVNPDGVDLVLNGPPAEEPFRSSVISINGGSLDFSTWKANIRGVDLNNQFPAMWEEERARKEIYSPAPFDYPGESPLSEPEAVAIAGLTRNREFHRVSAYHTQGKVIFWGYQGLEPPESRTIVNEFYRVSGYRPIQYVESFAGYKDWFIQEWRRPGFTVELGRGVNPLPITQFDEMYEETLGIFLANLYLPV
ncbi:M14 family metallopeptidase [Evansella clarkii]|uniref:M14 family metallopeptidase n=1 Tax=Evansella clarkii TaxID=79879 RepID=UPI000997DF14|nr:M14 family metallopeptidase [Evansella clarkii]